MTDKDLAILKPLIAQVCKDHWQEQHRKGLPLPADPETPPDTLAWQEALTACALPLPVAEANVRAFERLRPYRDPDPPFSWHLGLTCLMWGFLFFVPATWLGCLLCLVVFGLLKMAMHDYWRSRASLETEAPPPAALAASR